MHCSVLVYIYTIYHIFSSVLPSSSASSPSLSSPSRGRPDRETGPEKFLRIAINAKRPFKSDKVFVHSYQEIYGVYLLPFIDRVHAVYDRGFRLFEIGLGCSSPAKKKGVDVWASLLSDERDSIWVAEVKVKCAQKMIAAGNVPKRVKLVFGDQANEVDLQKWQNKTSGRFDAIIDDGSHQNSHILASLRYLFVNSLSPGGLYFIEDLQVVRSASHEDTAGAFIFSDVIKDWIEQLVVPPNYTRDRKIKDNSTRPWKHRILPGIKRISCQYEACVIAKCADNDVARCSTWGLMIG